MDRVAGGDANNILQSYTDILPGRPTSVEHRAHRLSGQIIRSQTGAGLA